MPWLAMGISRSNISNLFWQLFGHTFIAQLRDLRNQRKFFYDQGFSVNSDIAQLILAELESETGTIKIVYRNHDIGPTYGDFLCVVFLARICEVVTGNSCEFVLDDRNRHEEWNLLTDSQQAEFVSDQLILAKRYLNAKVELLADNQNVLDAFEICLSAGPVVLNRPLYQIAGDLTSKIYNYYADKNFGNFLLSPNRTMRNESFLSWGIRVGNWDKRRDSKKFEILSDYKFLRKSFPRTPIRVFTTQEGWALVRQTLTEHYKVELTELLVQKQKSENFLGASEEILSSLLHFQRNGGGIGMIPIYSRLPYFILSPDINYFPGRTLTHLVPWAEKSQLFFIVRYGNKLYFPRFRFFMLRNLGYWTDKRDERSQT